MSEAAPSRAGDEERRSSWIEARFRDLVERLPAVVYEAEPGPEGPFRYVSPQIEDLLGYSVAEWTGNPSLWLERLHPDDRDETLRREREHLRLARDAGTRMRAEYRMVHRGGRVIRVRDEARLTQVGPEAVVWRGLMIEIGATPSTAGAPGGDAVRLNCRACGETWVGERPQPCRRCGNRGVEAISLNAALAALAAAEQKVERLIEGIHGHLDDLGTRLGPGR